MINPAMSYVELLLEMEGHQNITYSILLTTREWQEKRLKIIRRDHHRCTRCGNEETFTEYDDSHTKIVHIWIDNKFDVPVRQADGTYRLEDTMHFRLAPRPYHMQVHHKRYIKNRLPWEYDDSDLVTLCNWCHWEFHQENEVDVFAEDGITLLDELKICSRCNGAGMFPEYTHIQGGVCFLCNGERFTQPLIRI